VSSLEPQLERECRTFASYLVGIQPTPYVCDKYVAAHADALECRGRFDKLLMRLARLGSVGTRMADSYARIFMPRAVIRKKLVVLLAILETCAPSFHLIDDIDSARPAVLMLRAAFRTAGFVVALIAAALFLFPAQLALTQIDKER